MSRSLIKICGITSVADAEHCARLGVDLLGLNFHPGSPRYLEPERAAEIAAAIRGQVQLVGVFVDLPAVEVDRMSDLVGLDLLQFHGDEPRQYVERFGERAVRAFRGDPACSLDPHLLDGYPRAWGFLFDVAKAGAYGGTGASWAYERMAAISSERRTLVAGGITPENARRALEASGASGIDVCSGVESAPGVKSRALVEQLVEEIRGGEE